jgi:hypothetical protein
MRDKKIYVLFLLLLLCLCGQSPALVAASSFDNVIQETGHTEKLNLEQMDEQAAEERATLFAKRLEENKDPKTKQQNLRSMSSLRKEADRHMEKKRYHKAGNLYYEASLYYPSALLLFKYAELPLKTDYFSSKKMPLETLRYIIKEYRLGLALYKYEPRNDKSLSPGCLKKIQHKVDCLWSKYLAYKNDDGDDAEIPREDILRCLSLGPDVFTYESYCK